MERQRHLIGQPDGAADEPEIGEVDRANAVLTAISSAEDQVLVKLRAWRKFVVETMLGTACIFVGGVELIVPDLANVVTRQQAPIVLGVGAGLMGVDFIWRRLGRLFR